MRTLSFRYTMWIPFEKSSVQPNWTLAASFMQEELYDHRDETPADFTHREILNLAMDPGFQEIKNDLRRKLTRIIQEDFIYLGPVLKMRPIVGYSRNGSVLSRGWYKQASSSHHSFSSSPKQKDREDMERRGKRRDALRKRREDRERLTALS